MARNRRRAPARRKTARRVEKRQDGFWTTVWTASMHGPYPSGNATGQPEMQFVFPDPAKGATNQSFRMIVRPDVFGRSARIRFTNVLGAQPLTLTDAHVGLQWSGSAILAGTNRSVKFSGRRKVTIAPGEFRWSDPVALDFLARPDDPLLAARKLAISFHVVGESGPMTWHAKALQHSYLAPPGTPSRAKSESERGFPFPTTAWYFIDALDMLMDQPTRCIVCFGDSITDGTGSVIDGDDRWPDVLSRRLHAVQIGRAHV